MKFKKSGLLNIQLFFLSVIFIISCAYLNNQQKSRPRDLNNDSLEPEIGRPLDSSLGLKIGAAGGVFNLEFAPKEIFSNSVITADKEFNNNTEMEDYKVCFNCNKSKSSIGNERSISKTDTNFVNSFINCYKTVPNVNGIKLDSMKAIIDHLENEYNFNQNRFQGNLFLEEILYNSSQSKLLGSNAKKVNYVINIPYNFRNALDTAENLWLSKDTLFYNLYANLTLRFIDLFNGQTLTYKEKVDLLIVFGYFSFIRYSNYHAMTEINNIFLPRIGINDIGNKFPKEDFHAMYHILAKYNINTYLNLPSNTNSYYYHLAYLCYKRANEVDMYMCRASNNNKCNSKEELVRVLMYSDNDMVLKRKALSYVTSNATSGLEYNKWLSIRAEIALNTGYDYYVKYYMLDSFNNYNIIGINSILNMEPGQNTNLELILKYETIGAMLNYSKNYEGALFYYNLAYKIIQKIPYNLHYDKDYGSVVLNLPLLLYKVGRKSESIELFEYLMKKRFCQRYFVNNLIMQFQLYVEDKNFSKAKKVNSRLFDSAVSLNNRDLANMSFDNSALIAKLKGHKVFEKVYTDMVKNRKFESGNAYIVGETEKIDEALKNRYLGDSILELDSKIFDNNNVIKQQNLSIIRLNIENAELSNEVKKKQNTIFKLDNIIAGKDHILVITEDLLNLTKDSLDQRKNELANTEFLLEKKKNELSDINIEVDKQEAVIKSLNHKILLAVIILLVFILVTFIIYRLYLTVKKQRRKLHIESNKNLYKSSMHYFDRHFISNITVKIKSCIRNNMVEVANQLIDDFTTLNREILKYGSQDSITLYEDIEFTKKYLDLNTKIIKGLNYTISYPENWEIIKDIKYPFGLTQIFCENSIDHGLFFRGNDYDKKLELQITEQANNLKILIKDNGVGRLVAAQRRAENNQHISYGTEIAYNKAKAFNVITPSSYTFSYEDDPMNEAGECLGTIVDISNKLL